MEVSPVVKYCSFLWFVAYHYDHEQERNIVIPEVRALLIGSTPVVTRGRDS